MIITKANFTKSNIITRTFVTPRNPSVAVIIGHQTSPYNSAYRWSTAGFGTRYTTVNAGEEVDGIAFNRAGDVVAYAIYRGSVTLNPAIGAWRWNGSTGFGTKYTNPGTLPPGTGYGLDFTANEDALAISHANGSYVSVYRWSYTTGFGTRYSNPASALPSTGWGCDFHPDDNALAVASSTPYVYQWNSTSGFGTRYSNPSGITTSAYDCEFSPDGTVLAYASTSTPWIHTYRWSSAGYGTKYSNPTTLPGNRTEKIAWNVTGTAVAVAGWMGVVAYKWNNTTGFGTRYSAAVAGDGRAVSFSNDNTAIAAASQDSPRIQAWPWNDNTGFGTKYSNPGTLPTGSAYSIQYSVR